MLPCMAAAVFVHPGFIGRPNFRIHNAWFWNQFVIVIKYFSECMVVLERRMLNYTCIVAKRIHFARCAGESPRDLGTCGVAQNNNRIQDRKSDHFQILTTSFKGNADFSSYGNGTSVYLSENLKKKKKGMILIGLKARLFISKMLICFLHSVFIAGLVRQRSGI